MHEGLSQTANAPDGIRAHVHCVGVRPAVRDAVAVAQLLVYRRRQLGAAIEHLRGRVASPSGESEGGCGVSAATHDVLKQVSAAPRPALARVGRCRHELVRRAFRPDAAAPRTPAWANRRRGVLCTCACTCACTCTCACHVHVHVHVVVVRWWPPQANRGRLRCGI